MSNTQTIAQTALVPSPEPRFLRENWKAVLGSARKDEYRFVRVAEGVASITNGNLLVRSPLPHIPNGFYLINQSNELVLASASSPRWMGYPDIDTCRPPFEKLRPSPAIPQGLVGELIGFMDMARKSTSRFESSVVMDRRGFYASAELYFHMPFEIWETGEEVRVNPHYLKMALTEMLRYPHIFIARQIDPTRDRPIVFGHDWARCALIMPLVSEYNGGLQYH